MSLYFGPINKSMYTQQLELIAKCLLYAGDSIQCKIKSNSENDEVYITIGKLTINLSLLMTKADFSHISLSQEDSNRFMSIIKKADETIIGEITNLTAAEIYSIKYYTSSIGYQPINDLLYHNKKIGFEEDKEIILKAIMLSSALNKIDPQASKERSFFGRSKSILYRGEGKISDEEIQNRIELIKQKKISKQLSFYSTTSKRKTADVYGHKAVITFENTHGHSVVDYSEFKHEAEYLQLPGYIQWIKHEIKKGKHEFHANIVNPVIKGKIYPTLNEIVKFKKLVEWAKRMKINVDYLTPDIKELLKLSKSKIKNQEIVGNTTVSLQGAFKSSKKDLLSVEHFIETRNSQPKASLWTSLFQRCTTIKQFLKSILFTKKANLAPHHLQETSPSPEVPQKFVNFKNTHSKVSFNQRCNKHIYALRSTTNIQPAPKRKIR